MIEFFTAPFYYVDRWFPVNAVLAFFLVVVQTVIAVALVRAHKRWSERNAVVVFLAVLVLCRLTARAMYHFLAPGVPDPGMLPTEMLPWYLPKYRSGTLMFWNSPGLMVIWLTACLAFVIPALLGFWHARRHAHVYIICGLLVAVCAWSGVLIWSAKLAFFPATTRAYLSVAFWSFIWVIALNALGILGGILLRWRNHGRIQKMDAI
jgi:hypothetical protein